MHLCLWGFMCFLFIFPRKKELSIGRKLRMTSVGDERLPFPPHFWAFLTAPSWERPTRWKDKEYWRREGVGRATTSSSQWFLLSLIWQDAFPPRWPRGNVPVPHPTTSLSPHDKSRVQFFSPFGNYKLKCRKVKELAWGCLDNKRIWIRTQTYPAQQLSPFLLDYTYLMGIILPSLSLFHCLR